MARRYTKTTNFIDKETENRYKSIPNYNVEPLSGDDQWIQALDGTRLDLISNDFYGSPRHWWVIALANKMGKGTLYVTPGSKLRIPANPQAFYDNIER